MDTESFASSDSARSGGALSHARYVTLDIPLQLELGGELPDVTVCYETYGTLSAERDNAVLICHALSGDSHVAQHHAGDAPGWWDLAVGPGRAIDTDRCFVICANVLGGCRGTTGPSTTSPATGRPYGGDFPRITIGDMVEVQRRLVDHLGIERLLAVVGGSMGGMQVLAWAVAHPDRVRSVIAVATTHRLSAQALAFDVVGRNAILKDPNYRGGQYYDEGPKPADGLAIARMIGHITYLSGESMSTKFDPERESPREVAYEYEKEFSVGSYLAYQGGRFVERFDANSYLALSLAMDHFDLSRSLGSLEAALARSRCRWLVLSFTSDWLFPPRQSRQLVDALIATGRPVSYCNVESNSGHDAFLLEDSLPVYGPLIEGFLARTRAGQVEPGDVEEPDADGWQPDVCSIYHGPRLDLELLEQLIPAGASVLDLGCGRGQLLARLERRGQKPLLGLELNTQSILAAVRRGLDVVQLDLDTGLGSFRDGQYDVVLLSQTLQTVRRPDIVVREMLRVGKLGIVSFPNFAHHGVRRQLAEDGIAPVTQGLPFRWYHTPNIRFLSIRDFEHFCAEFGITVHRMVALDTERRREVNDDPNLNADVAIFVISRSGSAR